MAEVAREPGGEQYSEKQLPEMAAYLWESYGDKIGLAESAFNDVCRKAEAHYTDLPYHNFHHAIDTALESMRLADMCELHGTPINRRTLLLGSLYHDAGFHVDLKATEYASKEARSADILLTDGPFAGFKRQEVAHAAGTIRATELHADANTIEEKIVVRADLGNVSGDFESSFIRKLVLLADENRRLHGTDDRLAFLGGSIQILTTYFSRDLKLGEWDKNWSEHAMKNIYRLTVQTATYHGMSVARFAASLGPNAVKCVAKQLQRG